MDAGIILIHFGEPPSPDSDAVEQYLTRIFLQNADLEGTDSDEDAEARATELAKRRAPGLIAEYEEIGGSPLNEQAFAQGEALQRLLTNRGYDVVVDLAFQFFDPTIPAVLTDFRERSIDHVIALPVYPLCGPSTTVASLETVDDTIASSSWNPTVTQITGWHRHPLYVRIRARNIRNHLEKEHINVQDDDTALLFSAHGTPMQYVEAGSRYVEYVEETCEAIGALLDLDHYYLGYQNHENRDIPWTQPDVEDLLEDIEEDLVVVEPMSFMHEQSETLAELDDDLADEAAELDLEYLRIPIPHDHPDFPSLLADLVEPSLSEMDPAMYQLRQCHCKPTEGTYCLNAPTR